MADTFIPVRLSYTGSAVTAIAEYQAGETMQHPGSVSLTGNGRLYQGDFSNGTLANRTFFQSNTANGITAVGALPNGTAQTALYNVFNSSDPTNASYAQLYVDNTSVRIASGSSGSGSNLPMDFYTGGAQRARLDASGNFYVATTNTDPIGNRARGALIAANGRLSIFEDGSSTCANFGVQTTASALLAFYYNNSSLVGVGSISTNGTTTAYNTSSDHRLKDNVADIDTQAAQARIMAYRPVTWTWKSNGGNGKGFIAHEAQAVDPDVATGTKDQVQRVGNIRAADYTLLAERVEEPADLAPYGEGATWSFTEEIPVYQGMDASFMIADMVAMLQKMRRELDETKAALRALQGA